MSTERLPVSDDFTPLALVHDADKPVTITPENRHGARAQEFQNAASMIEQTDGTIKGLEVFIDEPVYQEHIVVSGKSGETRVVREALQDTMTQRTYHKARKALTRAALQNAEPSYVKVEAFRELMEFATAFALIAEQRQ